MKKHLHNDFCPYYLVFVIQFTSEMIVALGSTAIVGFVLQLASMILNR